MGGAGQNLLTNTNPSTLPPTNPSGLPMQGVMVESIFRSTALPVVQEQFVKAVMGEELYLFLVHSKQYCQCRIYQLIQAVELKRP